MGEPASADAAERDRRERESLLEAACAAIGIRRRLLERGEAIAAADVALVDDAIDSVLEVLIGRLPRGRLLEL